MASLRHSHVVGPTDPPLMEDTIPTALARAVDMWGEAEALVSVHQEIRWTWSELGRRVDRLATGLLDLGIAKGDRVGIWSPNRAEWTLLQFATARIGGILVNINPAYRIAELEYTLNKVGVKTLVCAPHFKGSDYVAMVEALAPELPSSVPGELSSTRLPHLRAAVVLDKVSAPGWIGFDSIACRDADSTRLDSAGSKLGHHDPINIQFTSGTTGQPKGATLSHRNILNNAYFVGRAMGLRTGDRLCIPVPLYHCFGMVMGNLACLTHGATMVYPADSFSPGAVLEAVQRERCTALHGVPTMFIAMLCHPEFRSFDLRSLRTGIMAGSPCPLEVMRRVVDHMHLSDIGIAYGMTETSPVSMQSGIEDSIDRRVSTVGRIQPHIEVKIVDSKGLTTPIGEPGELCTRGYSVMLGYWNDPEKTDEAIDSDGWMHTGDLATIDDDGYCNIVGRIKDMLIRGGENVYPREVEEFLYGHPKVEDAQVVGVPDARYGEEVCAWIKLREGSAASEEEIREFCRGAIAHYKVPRYIRFVTAFPMTVTGKVQKFEIRRAMIEEMRLTEDRTA